MPTPVVVIGHRNPDNDSISAAVGYAYLKNQLAQRDGSAARVEYVPGRLGPLPPESAWVLKENGLSEPRKIAHLHTRVVDVMTPDPVSIGHDETMLEAGRRLRKHNVRALVVEGADSQFEGLISTRAIAERYISATDLLEDDNPNHMAVAASLIESLGQKVGELMATDVLTLDKETLLKDAAEDLMASELREGVVLNDEGRAIGIVTRSDIANPPKRKAILVDHNETRQAANGIEEADVVEIIDHHRIAGVSTANPIQFINLPVGSTATIVCLEYRKYGVDIPPAMAAVLLSAIMTDTVILKSPTTTDTDREQAQFLGAIIGEDPTEFGLKVFKARGSVNDVPIDRLVEADSKEFPFDDTTVLICQRETVDLVGVLEREQEIREHMRKLAADHDYEFVLLMVTDILAEGSQFICEGNRRVVNRVFGINCTGVGGTWMPGILSRKKQVAPRILGN
ncbi:putative manganese-dependent inorganic diphosphatase [Parvibacter caecicola]|uniref:putative manganese-dependent inorganic diphosphatase n=1 Tax=Parvibacter caecicola TaxID=747645 RepID=UPI002731CBDA|nr:putative manganese-dependent inorganic diphosphatase [Parvibacter caecicola]